MGVQVLATWSKFGCPGFRWSESDSSGAALQEILWLDDLPVGIIAGGVLYHIQPDHLGSPRKVIDSGKNNAIWDWPILNNPFGEAAPNQDPDGNSVPFVLNLRFPGQHFDAETGLHYNYFRDYEPGTGRYVESDPIGLNGGLATYVYAEQQPLTLTDELGLVPGAGPGRSIYSPCGRLEYEFCNRKCGARGVYSCKKRRVWHLKQVKRTKTGVPLNKWVATDTIECECGDSFCSANPAFCTVGVGIGIGILLITPWPDDVLIPCFLGGGTAVAAGS